MDTATSTIDFTISERQAQSLARLMPPRLKAERSLTTPRDVEDLPDYLAFFVAMGALTAEQAQAIVNAFHAGGVSPVLPDIVSDATSLYPAFKAYVESIETDSWLSDAFDWVVEHAEQIYEVVKAVIELASS